MKEKRAEQATRSTPVGPVSSSAASDSSPSRAVMRLSDLDRDVPVLNDPVDQVARHALRQIGTTDHQVHPGSPLRLRGKGPPARRKLPPPTMVTGEPPHIFASISVAVQVHAAVLELFETGNVEGAGSALRSSTMTARPATSRSVTEPDDQVTPLLVSESATHGIDSSALRTSRLGRTLC